MAMHNELWFPSVIWSAVINNVDNGALKKFAYDKIKEDDTFNFSDLAEFAPKKQLTLEVNHADGSSDTIMLNHTYNAPQIEWFESGSTLNLIKSENATA